MNLESRRIYLVFRLLPLHYMLNYELLSLPLHTVLYDLIFCHTCVFSTCRRHWSERHRAASGRGKFDPGFCPGKRHPKSYYNESFTESGIEILVN